MQTQNTPTGRREARLAANALACAQAEAWRQLADLVATHHWLAPMLQHTARYQLLLHLDEHTDPDAQLAAIRRLMTRAGAVITDEITDTMRLLVADFGGLRLKAIADRHLCQQCQRPMDAVVVRDHCHEPGDDAAPETGVTP